MNTETIRLGFETLKWPGFGILRNTISFEIPQFMYRVCVCSVNNTSTPTKMCPHNLCQTIYMTSLHWIRPYFIPHIWLVQIRKHLPKVDSCQLQISFPIGNYNKLRAGNEQQQKKRQQKENKITMKKVGCSGAPDLRIKYGNKKDITVAFANICSHENHQKNTPFWKKIYFYSKGYSISLHLNYIMV